MTAQSSRAKAMWRHCLASAFRTALACIIVGGATLYGPDFLKQQVAFPAFSFVTVILIVTDATLGHTFRCCWLAAIATVQGVLPAILSLWLIGPEHLTNETTAGVVAISAFVVALPMNTHLITKRIALGQIVIVYVVGYINGERTEPIMHPVHVAASTALGVGACVLALLFPYPNLAFFEVRENCRLYIENSSERLNLFVKSFSAEEMTLNQGLIEQAKSLKITGRRLLGSIKAKQESMMWEIFPVTCFKSYNTNPGKELQDLETVLNGMEIALTDCSEIPVKLRSPEIKKDVIVIEGKVISRIKSLSTLENLENTVLPQSDTEKDSKLLQKLETTNDPITKKDLPSLFFIFCLKLLQPRKTSCSSPKQVPVPNIDSRRKTDNVFSNIRNYSPITFEKSRLVPALKCSLSLGFAVFFGLVYSKENGYWSGLPVAISLAAAREATFKVANVKAQGTVIGTVYGVIGCFLFQRYVKVRFISLLPWFIFSAFLRQSKMYGQAGGISAVIGALLILGRKNFGSPSDFAIDRIVETFIGLSCSIMVDIMLQPSRGSVLAKAQLCTSFRSLGESVRSMTLSSFDKSGFEERESKLKSCVSEFGNFIEEAELEPNFWFLPFHSAGYNKLKGSLSKMVDLLLFGSHALEFIAQVSRKMDNKMWKEGVVKLECDLKVLRDGICSGIKCFEEVSFVKSISALDKEFERKKESADLEMGKYTKNGTMWSKADFGDEMENRATSFLQHLEEVINGVVGEEEMKIELVLSLSAIVFCMNGLLREAKEIEKTMKEIVQLENPSSQVDLHGISCKLHAIQKS